MVSFLVVLKISFLTIQLKFMLIYFDLILKHAIFAYQVGKPSSKAVPETNQY